MMQIDLKWTGSFEGETTTLGKPRNINGMKIKIVLACIYAVAYSQTELNGPWHARIWICVLLKEQLKNFRIMQPNFIVPRCAVHAVYGITL